MHQTITDALSERGYDTLTPVQEAVTQPDLVDKDLLVSAQTGSGKTVGFGLAIAPTLLTEGDVLPRTEAPLALIVAPTRELALQVSRELGWLYAKAGARVTTCIGGMDMRDERRALGQGAHIVVGTPGRLRDHIQRGSLDMTHLRAIVLDEADEMLDLGFREDLEFMLGEAPEDRRTLLFSATVPPMIAKLAKQFQRDATRVTTLTSGSQHADIAYQAVRVAQQDPENAIINLLRYQDAENAIVFANTRAMVNRLAARLTNRAFSVVALSGELSQTERSHALQAMRDGRARVCVATDVAARGIDLPKLELVIHAELPSNAEGLLHRSGRTGRAGRKGISALIVPPKAINKAERLLKFAKIEAEWITPPSADDIKRKDEERLLNDPVWTAEPTPEQSAFAEKLLAMHGPEKIAVAYLALHQSRLSAPEDLADPDQRPEPKVRKPFGPSVWFALSVGRNARAEPRWLLPLLCKAGQLDKDAIGAIRIQQSESYVEIRSAAVPGFLAAIGGDGMLEDGVTARQLDGAPDLDRGPRQSAPAPRKPETNRDETYRQEDQAPSRPPAKDPTPRAPEVAAKAAPEAAKTQPPKPKERGDGPSARPEARPAGTAAAEELAPPRKHRDTAPAEHVKKPYGKPAKQGGKPGGKQAFKGKPGPAKAAGKPKAAGPKGKPKAAEASAADTSKRFTPPGAPGKAGKRKAHDGPGKPDARRGRASGDEPPRRTKRH